MSFSSIPEGALSAERHHRLPLVGPAHGQHRAGERELLIHLERDCPGAG